MSFIFRRFIWFIQIAVEIALQTLSPYDCNQSSRGLQQVRDLSPPLGLSLSMQSDVVKHTSLYSLLCTTLNLSQGKRARQYNIHVRVIDVIPQHLINGQDSTELLDRQRSTARLTDFASSQTFIRICLSATVSFKYKTVPFAFFYPCRIPKSTHKPQTAT